MEGIILDKHYLSSLGARGIVDDQTRIETLISMLIYEKAWCLPNVEMDDEVTSRLESEGLLGFLPSQPLVEERLRLNNLVDIVSSALTGQFPNHVIKRKEFLSRREYEEEKRLWVETASEEDSYYSRILKDNMSLWARLLNEYPAIQNFKEEDLQDFRLTTNLPYLCEPEGTGFQFDPVWESVIDLEVEDHISSILADSIDSPYLDNYPELQPSAVFDEKNKDEVSNVVATKQYGDFKFTRIKSVYSIMFAKSNQ